MATIYIYITRVSMKMTLNKLFKLEGERAETLRLIETTRKSSIEINKRASNLIQLRKIIA